MAIDFGTSNTTRYYSVPDHADFILPNGDWTWLALVKQQTPGAVSNYILSTGDWGAANSFNLYTYGSTSGIAVKVDGLNELQVTGNILTLGTWYWVYAVRSSGVLRCGQIALNASAVTEPTTTAISAAYDSSTGPQIGRRAAGLVRNWNGGIGQVSFVPGYAITSVDMVELANGAPMLGMPFAPSLKFLLHGRNANDASITDLIGGKVATKQGTSYGTNEEDAQTPYLWIPEYVRGVASSGSQDLVSVAGIATSNVSPGTLSPGGVLLLPSSSVSTSVCETPVLVAGNADIVSVVAVANSVAVVSTVSPGSVNLTPASAISASVTVTPVLSAGGTVLLPSPAVSNSFAEVPELISGGTLAPNSAVSTSVVSSPSLITGGVSLTSVVAIANSIVGTPLFVTGGDLQVTPAVSISVAGLPLLVAGAVALVPGSASAVSAATVPAFTSSAFLMPPGAVANSIVLTPGMSIGNVQILTTVPAISSSVLPQSVLQPGALTLQVTIAIAYSFVQEPTMKSRFDCCTIPDLQDRALIQIMKDGIGNCHPGVEGSDELVRIWPR